MKIYVSKKRDPVENFIPGPGRNNGFPLHPGNLRCDQSIPVHSLVGHWGSRGILVGWTQTYGRLLSRTKRWLLNPGKSTVLLASSIASSIKRILCVCQESIIFNFTFLFWYWLSPLFQDILQRGSVQQLVLHVLHARDQGQVSPTDQADLHSYRRKSLSISVVVGAKRTF